MVFFLEWAVRSPFDFLGVPSLQSVSIVDIFLVPVLSWFIDPNWPVAGAVVNVMEWVAAKRPVLLALALHRILAGVLPAMEQVDLADPRPRSVLARQACGTWELIGDANGGTGEVEIGFLLCHVHTVVIDAGVEALGAFTSMAGLKDLVRRAADLEREARAPMADGNAGASLLDDWDAWWDDDEDFPVDQPRAHGALTDCFGFLTGTH